MTWPVSPNSLEDIPNNGTSDALGLSPRAKRALVKFVRENGPVLDDITRSDVGDERYLGDVLIKLAVTVDEEENI